MNEEWLPILDGLYEASNLGRIRRAKPGRGTWVGRELKSQLIPNGYLRVMPVIDGKNCNMYVHQLVAEAFLGPCPEGYEVNHVDANKTNNRADNLEYVTHQGNVQHAIAHGLMPQSVPKPKSPKEKKERVIYRGEDHWTHLHPERVSRGEQRNNKVTQAQVDEMRALAASGTKQRDLCQRYGLSPAQVCRIVNRKRWTV
jgi:hypothetical protein